MFVKKRAFAAVAAQVVGFQENFQRAFTQARGEIAQLREAQDDQLTAINENTDEIAGYYEYLMDVEQKMEHLAARVDQLQMMVRDLMLSQIEVIRTDDGKTVKLSQFY